MALYRFSVTIIGRANGHSAVAAAAYRSGEVLYSARLGRKLAYSHPERVRHREILAPPQARPWVFNRERLWNVVEASERRGDSQLAREVQLALPLELGHEAQLELARSFIRDEFVARGMVADFTIHSEGSDEAPQPHVHVMLTLRHLGADGFSHKVRSWNSHRLLKQWRVSWEHYVNRSLASAGRTERVDHRSYVDRGLNLRPQKKRARQPKDPFAHARDLTLAAWDDQIEDASANGDVIRKDPAEALRALTSNQATFTRRELTSFLHSMTADAAQFEVCLQAVTAHPDFVRLGRDDRLEEHFTARHVLVQEHSVLSTGRALAAAKKHPVRERYVERAAAERTLKPDQKKVLKHITRATGDLAIISGYAGTGKSWLLGAARQAWQAEGYEVVGAALAGKAAEGLQASSGIPSRTLDSWERGWERGRDELTRNHVFVIDEAGMVGTTLMERVLHHAQSAGAKVVIVGDVEQLQPIAAGAPMRVLRDQLAATTTVLSEIQRQNEDWQRQATVAFPQKRPLEALQAYAEHGMVFEHSLHDEALQSVVAAWERDDRLQPTISETKKGRTTSRPATSILLAYRRKEVRALNDRVRSTRRAQGRLGRDHVLDTRDREGNRQQLAFARGDRLYFLENDKKLDVTNGTLGTVENIRGSEVSVTLDEGRSLTFDSKLYDRFDHGYAGTVHKGQGVTVDRAYVLASTPFDSGASYVAMSRHRETVELHWAHDEFQYHVAQKPGIKNALRGAVVEHESEEVAFGAALDAWSQSASGQDVPALLVAPSIEQARSLNLAARELARFEGRLGADTWVRTLDGGKAFAVGDRVQVTDRIEELDVERSTLGTLTACDAPLFTLRLDDGRTVELDTTRHRALEHGYAMSIEQSRSLQVRHTIALATERLDDLAAERLNAPERGRVEIHGESTPTPTQDSFFEAISRGTGKEHALEKKAELERQQQHAHANHRALYARLAPDKRAAYLELLQKLADQPMLSVEQALHHLEPVKHAHAVLRKAESTLAETLAARAALRDEAGVIRKVGESFTQSSTKQVRVAEAQLAQARQQYHDLTTDSDLRAAAERDAATHNHKVRDAFDAWNELDERHHRPERQAKLEQYVRDFNLRAREPLRLASENDHGRSLRFEHRQIVGRSHAAVFSDEFGQRVAFDARRFGDDLSALERGQRLSVSPDFELTLDETQPHLEPEQPEIEHDVDVDLDLGMDLDD